MATLSVPGLSWRHRIAFLLLVVLFGFPAEKQKLRQSCLTNPAPELIESGIFGQDFCLHLPPYLFVLKTNTRFIQ